MEVREEDDAVLRVQEVVVDPSVRRIVYRHAVLVEPRDHDERAVADRLRIHRLARVQTANLERQRLLRDVLGGQVVEIPELVVKRRIPGRGRVVPASRNLREHLERRFDHLEQVVACRLLLTGILHVRIRIADRRRNAADVLDVGHREQVRGVQGVAHLEDGDLGRGRARALVREDQLVVQPRLEHRERSVDLGLARARAVPGGVEPDQPPRLVGDGGSDGIVLEDV